MTESRLHPEHLAHLRTSGLSDETIAAARIASLDERQAVIYGYPDGLTGIGFPYPGTTIRVNGREVPYTRLRVDGPKQRKPGLKYENPLGKRIEEGLTYYPYVPPGVEERRKKADQALFVTEGEKKALKMAQEGFPSLGLPGVFMFSDPRSDAHPARKPLHPDLLSYRWRKRTVYVCFDSDRTEKDSVALAHERLCAALIAAGANVLVIDVPRLPGLEKTGADDFLVAEGVEAFQALVEAAHRWEPFVWLVELLPPDLAPAALPAALARSRTLGLDREERRTLALALCRRYPTLTLPEALRMLGQDEPAAGVLPEVLVNDRQLREVISEAWSVLRVSSYGERLFRYGSGLVLIEEGGPRPVDANLMTALLNRAASWVASRKDQLIDSKLPPEVPRDMVTLPDERLSVVQGLTRLPVIHADGSLHARSGYDAQSQLYVMLEAGLAARLEGVPRQPSARQRQQALEWLLGELLVDFPFAGQADTAHAMAVVLLPLVRHLIDGPTPLHLIEAPSEGTGKTLLASALSLVGAGQVVSPTPLPQQESEIRKKLTSLLMTAPPLVLLDNVTTALDSESLAALLTGTSWSDRLLGQTKIVELSNRTVWLATANNPVVSREIARRTVRIRLDADVERPWLRQGFRHADLLGWLTTRRAEGLTALLTLVQAWIAEGRPPGRVGLGSFDAWARLVGGILEVAGVSGFLEKRTEEVEVIDPEEQEWAAFVQTWLERFGEEPVNSRDLLDLALESALLDVAPDRKLDASARSRFTRALSKRRDRRYGEARICIHYDTHHKVNLYFLKQRT